MNELLHTKAWLCNSCSRNNCSLPHLFYGNFNYYFWHFCAGTNYQLYHSNVIWSHHFGHISSQRLWRSMALVLSTCSKTHLKYSDPSRSVFQILSILLAHILMSCIHLLVMQRIVTLLRTSFVLPMHRSSSSSFIYMKCSKPLALSFNTSFIIKWTSK